MENYNSRTKTTIIIVRFIFALLIAGAGVSIIWVHLNAWIVIGIVLMIWSNNIERNTFKQ